MAAFKWAMAWEGVTLGPLVNARGRRKGQRAGRGCGEEGAKVLTGGKPPDGPGFFIRDRARLACRSADMLRGDFRTGRCCGISVEDENQSPRQRHRIWIDRLSIHARSRRGAGFRKLDFGDRPQRGLVSDPAAPFSMKQSGIGREGAHEGLMEFLQDAIRFAELCEIPWTS
jgi:succinate-semialdehyde dehydrogenase/glutarate-semialdehyde dehydrogenase